MLSGSQRLEGVHTLLRALDLHGIDLPRRFLPIEKRPWLQSLGHEPVVVPKDHFQKTLVIEPASVQHIRQHILPPPSPKGRDRSPSIAATDQQIWTCPTHPPIRIVVDAKLCLERSVYLAAVEPATALNDPLPLKHLMVAKLAATDCAAAQELYQRLDDAQQLQFFRTRQLRVPNLLRDAVFGRIMDGFAQAGRTILSAEELLTLHRLADGDLEQLSHPIAQLPAADCDALAVHFARILIDWLETMRHEQIVHGDLKPENIVFTADGSLSVIDYASAYGLWEAHLLGSFNPKLAPSYQALDDRISIWISELAESGHDSPTKQPLPQGHNGDASLLHWARGIYSRNLAMVDHVCDPHGRDVFSIGVTLLFVFTNINPFKLRDHENNKNVFLARHKLWSRLYLALEGVHHPFVADDDKEKAAAEIYIRAFKLLRERAPSIAPLVMAMLNPQPAQRITAEALAQVIDATFPEPAPLSPAILSMLQHNDRRFDQLRVLAARTKQESVAAVSRSVLRRHTVSHFEGPAQHLQHFSDQDSQGSSQPIWTWNDRSKAVSQSLMAAFDGDAESWWPSSRRQSDDGRLSIFTTYSLTPHDSPLLPLSGSGLMASPLEESLSDDDG